MNDDDDFGDLYAADVEVGGGGTGTLYEVTKEESVEERRRFGGDGDDDDKEDEEELLYGTSSSSAVAPAAGLGMVSVGQVVTAGFEVGGKDVENEETFLYGELYESTTTTTSVTTTTTTTAAAAVKRGQDVGGSSALQSESPGDSGKGASAAGIGNGNLYSSEARVNGGLQAQPSAGTVAVLRSLENPRGVGGSPGLGVHQHIVAPGLAPSRSSGLREKEEVVAAERGDDAGIAAEGAEEEWDSDSDDGLQIVLNDDAPTYDNPEEDGKGEFYEGSDEDEEDLIIVAGDEPLDGQENWGEDGGPLSEPPLPGPPSGGPPGAAERILQGGDDRGPPGKAGGQGSSLTGPRIGYSGQGYYNSQPHHAQYKYVRPGSGTSTGPASSQAGEPQPGGRGTGGGSNWGAGRGTDGGRGDWAGRGRGNSNSQRGSQGGSAPWGAGGGRGYSSGMEFNLPPTKTVFDIDLDTLEEKNWQRPGADITDYFNFGFNESSWKQYCQQLAQLRLEATMQSKIRVYESGRSEQEYDPDLPPELMAAQGLQDAPGEYGNVHQRQSDHGGQSGGGRGRGAGRGRPVMPTGRAIQVEGGGGERRPSADIRRQRTRDSDAVIQIVLQDASEDEPEAPVVDYEKEYTEDEGKGGKGMEHYNYHHEEEMRDFGPGGPGPWMDYYPYHEHWESGNMMDMPGEPMHGHMHPGMGVDGHFPMGPGMPMRPPGGGPEFGMFPGGPFGMPPYERGGVGRPPMYGVPRVGPGPMGGPGPDGFPQDHFAMQPPPGGFTEPQRRRTPPGLAHANRAGPHSGGDWEEELSNGSGANRSGHEHHSAHGNKDRESLSREHDADTRVPGGKSRSVLAEKGPNDPPLEQLSGGQKRSKSKEDYAEGEDSELGDKLRPAKRKKVVASQVNSSGTSSSDESSDSSLDNAKESAPARVRDTNHYQKVARNNNEAVEHHNYRSDSGSRRRPSDIKEREDLHRRERPPSHRGKDEPGYDRKSREDRERRDYDDSRHHRKDRGEERNDEARKRGRLEYDYHREREEPSRKREAEESRHWQRSGDAQGRVDEKKYEERSRHGDRREKDARPYDRDRDRARSRGRDEVRSHQREGNRSREEVSRADQEEERGRENYRRDDRLDERRDDTRSRGGERIEESRERDRNRRHMEDRHRVSEDRRKGDERSARSESLRKPLVNGREVGDDARLQIRRRDGSEEREADVARNGSLAKERSRDHAYDEHRRDHRDRDRGRLSSHYDDENRREKDNHHTSLQQDKEHVSERGDIRNSMRSKRPQPASRRSEHEDASGAYSTKEQQSLVEEASSGEDDGQERRGRSKIERWNSRKEREMITSTVAVDDKRHRRPYAREVDVSSEPLNADQHISEKRQDQARHENHHQDVEHNSRSDQRDRQQSSSAAKRYPVDAEGEESDAVKAKEVRSGVVSTKGSKHRESSQNHRDRQAGEDHVQQQPQDPEVVAKLERRKERFGSSKARPKKPSEEDNASRDESNYVGLEPVQADAVEVKQERPARKRRWAASG